jgi:hypothetical protein
MADRQQDRASLKDLDGVRVAVETLPAFLESRGVTAATLKTAIEAQLRGAGITVLGQGDFPPGDPYLRVTVTASPERSRLVACGVQVDFVQIVFLRRNPAVTFNRAQTWKADAQLALVPTGQVVDTIRRELSRQVDQFVEDYRATN